MPGFDRTLTQQYFILPLGYTTGNNLWIFIVNGLTAGAYITMPVVTFGNQITYFFTTSRAEIHKKYRLTHITEPIETLTIYIREAFNCMLP